MRLKRHRLGKFFAMTGTMAMLAMTATMVWGTGVSLAGTAGTTEARYFEDTEGNLCVGVGTPLTAFQKAKRVKKTAKYGGPEPAILWPPAKTTSGSAKQ